jgi:hypothetical protein
VKLPNWREISEVWSGDFEFGVRAGGRPDPLCLVARELITGREIRLWRDPLMGLRAAPFNTGPDAVFVAYYASAEMGCFLALGWPPPCNVLDLFTEHRCQTNRAARRQRKGEPKPDPIRNGLIDALMLRNLPHMGTAKKETMRERILAWFPFTPEEEAEILDYCAEDVIGAGHLFHAMRDLIDWPRALLRGRYMVAAARMEWNGIPIDVALWEEMRRQGKALIRRLTDTVDMAYGVHEDGEFREKRFEAYLRRKRIPWSRLPSGRLELTDDEFKERARVFPALAPLKELRATKNALRGLTANSKKAQEKQLQVGPDGRNRCLLSAFGSVTGRNQPSTSKFIFGPATWMRGLIRPPPGHAIAYLDWSGQEFAIAAALSGDPQMLADYISGDPHLTFAKALDLVPPEATKQTHPEMREVLKVVNLGVLYGMTHVGLAYRLNIPLPKAKTLLVMHRARYPRFWQWSEQVVMRAYQRRQMRTVFGWRMGVTGDASDGTLMNFPMQANAAEMMRIAAIAGTETGIPICAPVHDAFLICPPVERLDLEIGRMKEVMACAARAVIGIDIRVGVETWTYPDRYMDEARGRAMWETVMGLLEPTGVPDVAEVAVVPGTAIAPGVEGVDGYPHSSHS